MKKSFIFFVVFVFATCLLVFLGCDSQNSNPRTKAGQDLTNVYINANLIEESHTVEVEQTTSFINSSDNTINEIVFFAYANAYKEGAMPVSKSVENEAYPNGKNYGGVDIESITVGAKTVTANFSSDKLYFSIKLEVPLYPQDRVEVKKVFMVKLANIKHRLGYSEDVFSLAHFYMVPAMLNSDGTFVENAYSYIGDPYAFVSANYFVDFENGSDMQIASSGQVVSQTDLPNGRRKSIIKAIAARDFAIIASSKFQVIKSGKFSYFHLGIDNPQEILDIGIEAYNFFEDRLGKTYLPSLSIVEIPFVYGGMEYSGVATVTLDARKERTKYKEIVVHEIAHQWFFELVGNNQFAEGWVDESLTEFMTMVFMVRGNITQLRVQVAKRLEFIKTFLDAYFFGQQKINMKINRALDTFDNSNEYSHVVYSQGAIMYFCYMEVVGENKFFNALKFYVSEHRFGIATGDDLIHAFWRKASKDAKSFFDTWLDGNINLSSI